MRNKVLALSIILLLFTISLTSITFAQAQGGSWIGDYQIYDASTNALLVQHDGATNTTTTISPVLPGADIQVTFTVNVLAGGEGSLTLSTSLSKSSGQSTYWTLVSTDYTMGSQYNPAAQSTKFNWVQGSFQMSLRGTVPNSASASRPVNIVTLSGPSGSALGTLTVTSTSAKMNTFLTLYSQKNAGLNELISSGVDAGYVKLCTNVLNASKAVADSGSVDSAIALLNGIDYSSAPAGSTMQILFLPLVGVTAAIAVIFLVLFLRMRGRIGYYQLVVEDQIKDLEGLTLRARKIDRAMSASLDSIKDRLKNLVGM
jgi:hypothetical protein